MVGKKECLQGCSVAGMASVKMARLHGAEQWRFFGSDNFKLGQLPLPLVTQESRMKTSKTGGDLVQFRSNLPQISNLFTRYIP